MGEPSDGFLRVWNAGYYAAVFDKGRWGKFPPPHSEETVAGQVAMLVWFFLLYPDRFTEEPKSFAEALRGGDWMTLEEERGLIRRMRRRLEQDVGRGDGWQEPSPERLGRAEEQIGQFNPPQNEGSPLYRVIRRFITSCITVELRKARPRYRVRVKDESGHLIRVERRMIRLEKVELQGIDRMEEQIRSLDLAVAIAGLPAEERRILKARLEGNTWDEISEVFGKTVRQARRLMEGAERRLCTTLGASYGKPGG